MPDIYAELDDFRGSEAFTGIDFCGGYWKFTLHPKIQPLLTIMTPHEIVMPQGTTQSGCNSAK